MNYPTQRELDQSRVAAVLVLMFAAVTIAALVALLIVDIVSDATVPKLAYVVVLVAGLLAVVITLWIGGLRRGTTTHVHKTAFRPDPVDRAADRIKEQP